MDEQLLQNGCGDAIYPSIKLMGYKKSGKKKQLKFTWVKHLLFGDYMQLKTDKLGQPVYEVINGKTYLKVGARGKDGYILPKQIQAQRILEVNFVDVGQGDGCHIVTPEDHHYIVDAGPSDNMFRFLLWRFNLEKKGNFPPPMKMIITHSDADHYMGFTKLFDHTKEGRKTFRIEKIFHNGMVEKSGASPSSLGTPVSNEEGEYITGLCENNDDFVARATTDENRNGKYIKMLLKTDAEKQSLRAGDPPLEQESLLMKVLGPVTQQVGGRAALPIFEDSKGKTKNGHSIILKIEIGYLSLLLGGDLNEPAEDYLMQHYTGTDLRPLREDLKSKMEKVREDALKALKAAVNTARDTFRSDIAKSCHHGSSDFTGEFMDAINPVATIISSGDNEPHSHPRPDTLGTIGKYSRGSRSLIFATELARSTPEFLKAARTIPGREQKVITKQRLVTVYGMINVRTDGKKVIIAQKLEAPATRGSWDIHELIYDEELKEFVYQGKPTKKKK